MIWEPDGDRLKLTWKLPAFRTGRKVALLRCALVITSNGELAPTRIVESPQLRRVTRRRARKASFNTYTRTFGPQLKRPPVLFEGTLAEREAAAVYWKQTRYDWGLLRGLMKTSTGVTPRKVSLIGARLPRIAAPAASSKIIAVLMELPPSSEE